MVNGDTSDLGAHNLILSIRPPDAAEGYSIPSVVWMRAPIQKRLSDLHYDQPVSLDKLAGKWWSIHTDLATLGRAVEPGCSHTKTVASTESIAGHFAQFWVEIVAGPFESADEGSSVYLAGRDTDVAWLGDDALVCRVEPWIVKQLGEHGFTEPVSLSKLAGMFWVCGTGGGWRSTA